MDNPWLIEFRTKDDPTSEWDWDNVSVFATRQSATWYLSRLRREPMHNGLTEFRVTEYQPVWKDNK